MIVPSTDADRFSSGGHGMPLLDLNAQEDSLSRWPTEGLGRRLDGLGL